MIKYSLICNLLYIHIHKFLKENLKINQVILNLCFHYGQKYYHPHHPHHHLQHYTNSEIRSPFKVIKLLHPIYELIIPPIMYLIKNFLHLHGKL